MRSNIHPDRDTAMRWAAFLGACMIGWLMIMGWSLRGYPAGLRVNGDRPMLSIELAPNDQSLRLALGDGRSESESKEILAAVKVNTYLDFILICLYTAFLATFTCWVTWEPRRDIRGFTVFLYACLMIAALCDNLENIGILNSVNGRGGAGAIWIPSFIKWATLAIAIGAIGVYLLSFMPAIVTAGLIVALFGGGAIMAGLVTARHGLITLGIGIRLEAMAWFFDYFSTGSVALPLIGLMKAARSQEDTALLEELEELFATFTITDPSQFLAWLKTDPDINTAIFDDIPDLKQLRDWIGSGEKSLPDTMVWPELGPLP